MKDKTIYIHTKENIREAFCFFEGVRYSKHYIISEAGEKKEYYEKAIINACQKRLDVLSHPAMFNKNGDILDVQKNMMTILNFPKYPVLENLENIETAVA